MSIDHLPENLRLLCSYGRSASDVCRRAGLNRQQLNKYLTGRSRPSLSTLRRLCDFFGVDDHEILLDSTAFKELIRIRPPRLGVERSRLDQAIEGLIRSPVIDQALLARHEGYYHAHTCPDPGRGYILRALSRIYREDGTWLSKTVERHLSSDFMLPPTLKYRGIVLEALHRIVINEREQGVGQSLWTTMLFATDHTPPTFLSGLTLGITPEGSHDISCVRTVWQFLGKSPDLRQALGQCGLLRQNGPEVPDFVRACTNNTRLDGELVFSPKF